MTFFARTIRNSADMQTRLTVKKKDVKVIVGALAGLAGAMVHRHLQGRPLSFGDVLLGAAGGGRSLNGRGG